MILMNEQEEEIRQTLGGFARDYIAVNEASHRRVQILFDAQKYLESSRPNKNNNSLLKYFFLKCGFDDSVLSKLLD